MNENKDKNVARVKTVGLRTTPYVTSVELVSWMKLCLLCGELEAIARQTENGAWRKLLKPAHGLIWKVVLARMDLVDPKQFKSIQRRKEHSEIRLFTSDECRLPQGSNVQERVNIAYEDLLDLADLASNSCCACPQGECVKDCFYRKVFHRVSLPPCRDNPAEGECEFSYLAVGEVEQVKPRNQRQKHYFAEDGFVL